MTWGDGGELLRTARFDAALPLSSFVVGVAGTIVKRDTPADLPTSLSPTVALFPDSLLPKRLINDFFSGEEPMLSFQLLVFLSSSSPSPLQVLFCPLFLENDRIASLLPLMERNCLLLFFLDNDSFFDSDCFSLVSPDLLFCLSFLPALLLSFTVPRDDLDLGSFDLTFFLATLLSS